MPPSASPVTTAVSRDGTFAVGESSFTARVGPVHEVTVSVRAGVKVTLSVTCGLTVMSATSVSSATVRVHGGDACVATFSVPSAGPQPTPWQLVTR